MTSKATIISLRLPKRTVDLLDALVERVTADDGGIRITRATIHRKALSLGIRALNRRLDRGKDGSA